MKGSESLFETEGSMSSQENISKKRMTKILFKIIKAAINYPLTFYLPLLLFIA